MQQYIHITSISKEKEATGKNGVYSYHTIVYITQAGDKLSNRVFDKDLFDVDGVAKSTQLSTDKYPKLSAIANKAELAAATAAFKVYPTLEL
jgi:hypothetical protein